MNSYYEKIHKYFVNIHIFKLIMFAIGLSLLNDLSFKLLIANITSAPVISDLKKEGLGFFIFITIIIGPFIETILCQTLPIWFVQKILKIFSLQLTLIPVIISALIFGTSHWYYLPYMILMSFRGVIYAWIFIIVKKRPENATLVIYIVHSLNNLVILIDDIIL